MNKITTFWLALNGDGKAYYHVERPVWNRVTATWESNSTMKLAGRIIPINPSTHCFEVTGVFPS